MISKIFFFSNATDECICTVLNKHTHIPERIDESERMSKIVRLCNVMDKIVPLSSTHQSILLTNLCTLLSFLFQVCNTISFSDEEERARERILSLSPSLFSSEEARNGLGDRTDSALHLSYKHRSTSEPKRFDESTLIKCNKKD